MATGNGEAGGFLKSPGWWELRLEISSLYKKARVVQDE
jgi:hypothetical protein